MTDFESVAALQGQYKSRIVDDSSLGFDERKCSCGSPLRRIKAIRYSNHLSLRGPRAKTIDALRCDRCFRFYVETGFLARWFSTLSFAAVVGVIWMAILAIPSMFLVPTIESMKIVDWEAIGAWALYAMVGGFTLLSTGRMVWRRTRNALVLRAVETDPDFGHST